MCALAVRRFFLYDFRVLSLKFKHCKYEVFHILFVIVTASSKDEKMIFAVILFSSTCGAGKSVPFSIFL